MLAFTFRRKCLVCDARTMLLHHLCADCSSRIQWIVNPQCSACGRGQLCPDCVRQPRRHLACNRSAVTYSADMKRWLAAWKYRGNERLEPLFSDMIAHAWRLLQHRMDGDVDLITYVPVSDVRLAERGFNQSERLARALGKRFSVPVAPLLVRNRHSAKQSSRSRAARLAELDRTFLPSFPSELNKPINRIVIADDVYTTGSTLEHCAEAIRSVCDAQVFGVTWAR